MWITLILLGSMYLVKDVRSDAATDYNEVNRDGSFSFGYSNDDIGGHYHSASGSADKIVRGRYGSRNSANGRIEETVYTAGPRGYRAQGPQIHRKMDLSQYPAVPIGTPEDPLADPYEDPSYNFNFKSLEYNRQENADSTGRVRGLYSYLDDIGERHTVRYAAGAGTGFEVINAVPDSPASVAYSSPLYKAPKGTRGRMAVQRGPDGQYKFILSGPDQRRSESSGPDGIVRGSYSYLDDKGVQRTVQYIAGAGIGYRVVHSTTGSGTHLAPRPALPEYGIRDFQSNNLADDDGYLHTAESGRFRPKDDSDRYDKDDERDSFKPGGSEGGGSGGGRGGGGGRRRPSRPGLGGDDRNRADGDSYDRRKPRPGDGGDNFDRSDDRDFKSSDDKIRRPGTSVDKTGETKGKGYDYEVNRKSGGSGVSGGDRLSGKDSHIGSEGDVRGRRPTGGGDYDSKSGSGGQEQDLEGSQRNRKPSFGGREGSRKSSDKFNRADGDFLNENKSGIDRNRGGEAGIVRGGGGREGEGKGGGSSYQKRVDSLSTGRQPSGSGKTVPYNDYDTEFPLVTGDHRRLEIDREKDWSLRGRDSTIIKNVGKWYIGLPPGSAVRAHIQNIDLLPLNGRLPSPSEALRRDELGGN